jgi:signal transduction histidine kinase
VSGGLTRRMAIASGLLALIIAGAFAVLLWSVADLRDAQRLAKHSQEVLAAANRLERLIIDVETGQRGFAITQEDRFLQPWREAQAALPEAARTLERLTVVPAQHSRALRITQAAASYVEDYSVPLVATARRDPGSARTVPITEAGKQRVDAIRAEFDGLVAAEGGLAAARQERSDAAARRAIVAAVAGLGGSVLLILLFSGYLTQAIVRPVRQAAAMAGQLAGGDLAVRLRERGVDEIGLLERSFNSMAGSLEENRDQLNRLLDEQAALRRVATLVARGVPPAEVFTAVAEEVGRVLGTDSAHISRYEPDETMSTVAAWSREGDNLLTRTHYPIEPQSMSDLVLRTGQPIRIDSFADAHGTIADMIREFGIRSAVGCPIMVEGRLWGHMSVTSKQPEPLPPDTETRVASFTELVATAIANSEARAELAASRARIVRSADETRRRIERDLHDGIQQRLVSLGLDLRTSQAAVPTELPELEAQLARVSEVLGEAVDELRELSRGIHPAILSEGGLGPALKVLARRSPVPVELEVHQEGRLPAPVEVAAYYVIAEALTNTAKHADASVVHVDVRARAGLLRLAVEDDGVGGADPSRGSGLVGLSDRVQALGGTITVHSPAGQGTRLLIKLVFDREDG